MNPYAPPAGPIGQAGEPAVQKSFARRLSVILAAFGFVAFWGGGALIAYRAGNAGVTPTDGLLFGVILLLVISAHIVGVSIVFAAPRGLRLLPGLLNGVALAIMVTISVLAFVIGPR